MNKNNLYILYIIILLSFGFQNKSYSQDFINEVEVFNINNGLTQNFITNIIQDKEGFLWIGTQAGLNKFNGYSFTPYFNIPGDNYSISNNYVRAVCQTEDGNLWIATRGGLNKYNYKTKIFESFKPSNNSNSIHDNNVLYVFEDSQKIIWIKSLSGLNSYNPKTNQFLYYEHEVDEFKFTTVYNYYTITESKDGILWSGSNNGLLKFNKNTTQFQLFKPNESTNNENNNEVFCVLNDSKNNLWVGTSDGLKKFNKKNNTFKHYEIVSDNQSEVSKTITCIFEDKDGEIWLGTENGIAHLNNQIEKVIQYNIYDNNENNIVFGRIATITADRSGILWIGCQNGLFKLNKKTSKFKLYKSNHTSKSKLSSNRVYSIFVENDSIIWFGTRNYGLNIYNRKSNINKIYNSKLNGGLTNDIIHSIQRDKKGNILVGSGNGVFVYDKIRKTFSDFFAQYNNKFNFFFQNNRISNIIEDRNGNYWFATYNGLLFFDNKSITAFKHHKQNKYEISSNEITRVIEASDGAIWVATDEGLCRYKKEINGFEIFNKDNSNLSNNSILSLIESSDGSIWAGTESGINRLRPGAKIFEYYTQKDGFANDYIYSIVEDKKRNLWMSTNKGLVKFNPETKQVINFESNDGLQGFEFNIGSYFSTSKGEIFFGGIDGVNSFYPDSIMFNKFVPVPVISNFQVISSKGATNIGLDDKNEVFLKTGQNNFKIEFSILEFTHHKKNRYKYKITETDNVWIDIGTTNYVWFTQFPAGDYTFQVIGSNSDNIWNPNPTVFKIHIAKSFWITNLAIIIYVIVILSLIFAGISLYNKKIRKENKRLQETEKSSKEIEKQRQQLSIKNQNISDSIHYAKRIIDAMMPSETYFKKILPESVILYMPKDIVSGDFYWTAKYNNKIYVAAADCTGHGVPGAFMSIVGLDLLRNILSLGIDTPSEILNKLNKDVSDIFKKELEEENTVRDGMDISVCCIDVENKQLGYAGAINPLYLIRDNNIIEIRGDRFPVGPVDDHLRVSFKNHMVALKEDDLVYIFSDGFADQFGGPMGKKFKFRRFRHLLLTIHKKDFVTQKKLLHDSIVSWRGNLEQVDDILVLGFRPLGVQDIIQKPASRVFSHYEYKMKIQLIDLNNNEQTDN